MPAGIDYEQRRLIKDAFDEGYEIGFRAGQRSLYAGGPYMGEEPLSRPTRRRRPQKPKKKRTLTAWQKFVKTNSKKKEFRLRGGKVNLKKLGVAYRKKTGKRKGKK